MPPKILLLKITSDFKWSQSKIPKTYQERHTYLEQDLFIYLNYLFSVIFGANYIEENTVKQTCNELRNRKTANRNKRFPVTCKIHYFAAVRSR